MIYWLIESTAKCKMGDFWREMVNRLIEVISKCDVRDVGGKMVNWLIEVEVKIRESLRRVILGGR